MAVNVLEHRESFGASMCLLAVCNARNAQGHVHGPHAVEVLHLALDRGVVRVEECGRRHRSQCLLAGALQVVAHVLRHHSCIHLLLFSGVGLNWRQPHSTVARHAGVAAGSSCGLNPGCTVAAREAHAAEDFLDAVGDPCR